MVWQPVNLTAACQAGSAGACSSFAHVFLSLLVQLYGGSSDQCKQQLCDREAEPARRDHGEYDFIVVGAGAAGCVIANRLTENPKWKVLLLEAGPEEPDITSVPGLAGTLQSSNIDWQYTTEPNGKSCLASGGRCAWPRGKTMGGSSSINGMAYVRGNMADYDRWALMGNEGWSYRDVLPFFLKSERNMNKDAVDSDYHGAKGEQPVGWFPYVDDPANMLVEAYNERGIPFRDYNGAEQVSTMQLQAFQVDGERVSANKAFISPIRHKRTNLFIKSEAEVTKILIDKNDNAYGVEYVKGGVTYKAHATKEVIVSAGTINSAKLLMLSGIGPREHLESLNIPVIQDLAVGENLHDHVSFDGIVIALSNDSSTAVSNKEMISSVKKFHKMKIKKGPLTGLGPVMSSVFLKTEPYLTSPDLQNQASPIRELKNLLRNGLTIENLYWPAAYYEGVIPRTMNLVPKSRGKLLLNEDDPHGPPRLHVNYLGDDRDLIPLMKGVRFLLSLENTEAFKARGAYYVREQMPHCKQHEWGTDEYFLCLIKQYTSTTHHQVGTCKMGPKWDKKAVLDNKLRVYGIKWLRVIDASMMPVVIRGNTCAPAMMIAERGIDFVIKEWQHRTNNYCF
ncbi:glucose dehydrogenase [FAD, quinone]-like [Bicyclus anynana]|uniref:Glucose dehydrogenase [FAD, quinone]-like n=1 Tax=Bicyclus anynana TaxID=110368 RepID=A0ABM3LXG1_BICAN|nr:glucose dehydrogenase [FAD, quinone]-like [Bicyclus anynana]